MGQIEPILKTSLYLATRRQNALAVNVAQMRAYRKLGLYHNILCFLITLPLLVEWHRGCLDGK